MTPLKSCSGTLSADPDSRSEIVLLAAGIVTMAFGLLALLGWVSGWLRLASFGVNMIPMAPSTAVLFLLYGAAIGCRARTPLSRLAFRFSVALAGLGTLVALLLFTLGWLNIQWVGEHLGLNITGTVGDVPIGHMSLATAFFFLLAGGSFLASLSPSATRPWRVGLALVSAGVLLATSFICLLAYGFGTPLLYGSTFIPPALNTLLAFVPLGLALLILAGQTGGLFCRLPGDDSKPALNFVLIFLLLGAGIVAIGYAYYRGVERQFRAEAESQLAAIAELKVGELVQWRQERLAAGGILFRNAAFSALVRRVLDKPEDADAQQQVRSWLAKYATHFRYDEVRLLDNEGVTRLSAPADLPAVSPEVAAHAAVARQSGQMALQDFFRSVNDRKIRLAILIPILDEADGNRPLGVVVLRIDPSRYLYPFVSRWPLPSATAETLLVRREGNAAVFLNELRFQTNTALTLRVPLANTNMPAVMAALGQEGIVDGIDYRGVPVLAAVSAVPDSPWGLVARRDVAEVYAPLRTQLWQVIALVGVLLFGAGAGVNLIWRRQRVRFYQEQAAMGVALQKSQSLLSQAEELGRIGGWEFDIESKQLTWSKTVYDIHELDSTGHPTVDQSINYCTPASRPIIERAVQRAIELGERFDLDLEIITAKGNRRSVHTTGEVDRARRKVSGFFQDITARKQAEDKARQSHDLLANLARLVPGAAYQYRLFPDGRSAFPYSSPGMNDIYEVTPEEVREDATPAFGRLHPDDYGRVSDLIQESARTLRTFYCEFRVILPRQGLRWRWSQAQPERIADGGTLWHGIISDITERKQAEEAMLQSRQAALNLMLDAVEARDQTEQVSQTLRASEAEVRELNRTLEQRVQERTAELRSANQELEAFAYAVSHDLRQPLRAMNGFSRALLEDHAATLPGEACGHLDEIILASRRMGELIDGLLRLSRSTRGELRRDAVGLSAMSERLLGELAAAEPNRRVTWTVEPGLAARGDERMLEVVLTNLLGNAWKYTAKTPQPKIEVGAIEHQSRAVTGAGQDAGAAPFPAAPVFFVRDNGVGFDMKHAARLFQPFQRLHREDEFPGIGIGLATVQRIVHRHGGAIRATAAPGAGATFCFSLSLEDGNDA